jgi:hypothetical protein
MNPRIFEELSARTTAESATDMMNTTRQRFREPFKMSPRLNGALDAAHQLAGVRFREWRSSHEDS